MKATNYNPTSQARSMVSTADQLTSEGFVVSPGLCDAEFTQRTLGIAQRRGDIIYRFTILHYRYIHDAAKGLGDHTLLVDFSKLIPPPIKAEGNPGTIALPRVYSAEDSELDLRHRLKRIFTDYGINPGAVADSLDVRDATTFH